MQWERSLCQYVHNSTPQPQHTQHDARQLVEYAEDQLQVPMCGQGLGKFAGEGKSVFFAFSGGVTTHYKSPSDSRGS